MINKGDKLLIHEMTLVRADEILWSQQGVILTKRTGDEIALPGSHKKLGVVADGFATDDLLRLQEMDAFLCR